MEEEIKTTPTMLEETRAVLAEMKQANSERLALIEREERNKANELLGGRSEAGAPAVEKKEETAQEYAARVLSGRM